jgi:hypothetical protein
VNDSVWAGSDRVISGPYHSNGGVRMDGTSNSSVTSSVSSWDCTSQYGCTPEQATAPGVLGNGTDQNLWDYPTPQVDFGAISADFSSLKATAQASGKYWSTGSPSSEWSGQHLIFNADGTVTVKNVTRVTSPAVTTFVDGTTATTTDNSIINAETTTGTYSLPSDCGLIFVENRAWIEGTVKGKVTVVVADVTSASGSADVIFPNSITYSAYDGTSGLTVVAQDDVLIGPNSPGTMTLNGVFIAQSGAFGRNYYGNNASYEPKSALTILGTTVSNKRTGTKWCLNQSCSSYGGYASRTDSYDRRIASDPPPFTPVVSSDYELMDWHEQ